MIKMEQTCWMCGNTNQVIKEYTYWKLLLHPNMCYLGRCMIVLNRHIEDITEITDEEREELFMIMKKLRKIITDLFRANLFNYFSAGNITRHLHMHFIPRYDHEVEFEGIVFKDERWNKNYAPYPKELKMPKNILNALKQKIGSQLN